MEGNFYVSDVVIDRELRSCYGKAYIHCKREAQLYGRCIETNDVNHTTQRDCCLRERKELRKCVDTHMKGMRGRPSRHSSPPASSYSPYDSVRKPPSKHRLRSSNDYVYAGPRRSSEAAGTTSTDTTATTSSTAASSKANNTNAAADGSKENDNDDESEGGGHVKANKAALHVRERTLRPRQSPVEARRERAMFFPQTLPSGRYAQRNTVAQRMAYANPKIAAEVARQDAIDREYVRRMRDLHDRTTASSRVDRRFFRLFTDYRDIADGDPYSDIFGRTKATEQLRTAVWQRQFEAENADVLMPYERTSFLRRRMPNWLVRRLLAMRDAGGMNTALPVVVFIFTFMSLTIYIASFFYVPPEKQRPLDEVR